MKANSFFLFLVLTFFSLFSIPRYTTALAAPLPYGNGYYTNLCGTGTAASADTCNKGCNPATGSCTSEKPYVIKWTCNGNMQECRLNEMPFATTQNIGNTACDQTVLIQVYNRNCRSYFGWICNEANLQDSMLWYSGSCAPTPMAPLGTSNMGQETGSNKQETSNTGQGTGNSGQGTGDMGQGTGKSTSTCEELTLTKGNGTSIPATVGFHTRATGAYGYRFYFGDGTMTESAMADTEHRYDVSGNFISRVEIKDSLGNWTSSGRCETPVTVQSNALETQKSDCSDLFIIEGNNTQAPATVSLRVTGYDNKGAIRNYRIAGGTASQAVESVSGAFQMKFEKPGTYVLHGAIEDSTAQWKQGGNSCTKTVYVETEQLTRQPETGASTAITVLAVTAGIIGISYMLSIASSSPKKKRKSKHIRLKKAHS